MQICTPQFNRVLTASPSQEDQLISIRREDGPRTDLTVWQARRAVKSNLTVSRRTMHPDSPQLETYRTQQRFSVRSYRNTFLFRGSEGNLFRLSIGKRLAPQMKSVFCPRAKIDPLPIRRPGPEIATGVWTDKPASGTSVKGDDAAGPRAVGRHLLGYQDPFVVGRDVGMMRHAFCQRRNVHVTLSGAAFGCGNDRHMKPAFYFREQNVLIVDPRQRSGVGQHQARLSTEHRNNPGVPRRIGRIGNLRTIWRKGGRHFVFVLVRELHRIAAWQHFDVKVTRGEKCARTAQKCQHLSIGRQGRGTYGIRKIGELLPLLPRWRSPLDRKISVPGNNATDQQHKNYSSGHPERSATLAGANYRSRRSPAGL